MEDLILETFETDSGSEVRLSRRSSSELTIVTKAYLTENQTFEILSCLRELIDAKVSECGHIIPKIVKLLASAFSGQSLLAIGDLLSSSPTTIRIVEGPAKAAQIPWELLPAPEPIALYPHIRIVRTASQASIENPPGKAVLQFGLYTADSHSQASGGLHESKEEIRSIANHLQLANVKSTHFEPATRSSVLLNAPDIFHFIGHGKMQATGGSLLFADGPLRGSDLASELRPKTMLAVLSACNTAGDPRSVGSVLAKSGLPAVVAMQLPISDTGAVLFSQAFYTSLAEGRAVEDALHYGRATLPPLSRDWLAPVLIRSGFSDPIAIFERTEHNFPVMPTQFIGRRLEVQSIVELLDRSSCRLLTLTGIGGIGKTTLGHAVGIEYGRKMVHGAFLVPCEAVQTRADLLAATLASLGVEDDLQSEESLLAFLGKQRVLLVYDCFERIVHLSHLLTKIIQTCPHIKILVTSRVLLNVVGEHEFSVPPLSSKRRKKAPSEAVEFFVEAARRHQPDFDLTRSNSAQVASMVQDLECVPLAIVLAANRLRHFSLEELAQRIHTNRLQTLRRRARFDDKHSDLYRVIGDSLDLIEEPDRRLLGILTVFSGGFYLEDALEVIGDQGDVEAIAWLRDNSLLNATIQGGRMRYRMLDTIREYMSQTSYVDDLRPFVWRHAKLFAQKSEAMASAKGPAKWSEIGRLFPVESANYRLAATSACKTMDFDLARVLCLHLARIFAEFGRREEFALLSAFAQNHFLSDVDVMAEIYGLAGVTAFREGDHAEAMRFWRSRADICRDRGMAEFYADSLLDMANMCLSVNDHPLLESLLAEFDQIPREDLSQEMLASGLVMHARLAEVSGEFSAQLEFAKGAEGLLSDGALTQGQLFNLMHVAKVYWRHADHEKSLLLAKRTVAQALETSHYHSAGMALLELSRFFRELGDFELAMTAVLAGIRIPRNVSSRLRAEFEREQKGLEASGHSDLFRMCSERYLRQDWKDIALFLARA